jgi:hypothetical protein
MTDRIRYLTVVLEADIRTDDIESTVEAIKHIRGVASVELGKPVDMTDRLARDHARREIREQVIAILYPENKP